jgi:hypothetical protein
VAVKKVVAKKVTAQKIVTKKVTKPAPKNVASKKTNQPSPAKGPSTKAKSGPPEKVVSRTTTPSVAKPATKPAKPVAPVEPVKVVAPIAKSAPAQPAPKPTPVAAPRSAPTATSAPITAKPAANRGPRKERVVMEFYVHSSPNVLYELISTPSGFAEWYCTDVHVRGEQWTFVWAEEQEETTMIGRRLGEVIRFHRNDDEDEATFFEFRIRIDDMTNEVALIVTDHGWPHEVDAIRNLWSSQIANLVRVLGA